MAATTTTSSSSDADAATATFSAATATTTQEHTFSFPAPDSGSYTCRTAIECTGGGGGYQVQYSFTVPYGTDGHLVEILIDKATGEVALKWRNPTGRKLGQTVRAAAPPPTMPEKDEDIDMASVTVDSSVPPPPPYVPLPRTLVEGTADTVVLVGAGGGRFVVTHREARCSAVLAKHLDERPEDREISLSEIDDAVLARIVAYMEYKVLFTGKPCTIPDFPIDAEEARRVLIASSALDC